jgi:hypothetical protein
MVVLSSTTIGSQPGEYFNKIGWQKGYSIKKHVIKFVIDLWQLGTPHSAINKADRRKIAEIF